MRTAVAIALGLALGVSGTRSAAAEPAWTTYHRDPGRSGYDSEAGEPVTPALDWQSPALDGPIWGQPLELGARVYVASIADGIYALEASTGKVIWHVSAGTPVPSGKLPCGDIEPTVGIVGTPVIDPTRKAIYAVADTWDESHEEAHHLLKGYSLADGKELLSTPVDPPGSEPTAYLQRPALNLDHGNVVFGFGGNDGDCANYQGAVVAVPENGGAPRFWQYHPIAPSFTGGAVWGVSGPIVDGAGEIYAATGNPNPTGGKEVTKFDDSDALLRLDPSTDLLSNPSSEPTPLGWFQPPSWQADSNADVDLGSAGPELLPGEMIFQAGKNGTGYLLPTSMSGETAAVYKGPVCNGGGSFGGDAFANGVIYMACTNGVQALSYDQSKHTFTPLWQGPLEAVGPPIVAGGLVWDLSTAGFGNGETLYGLDPATGKATYTETLPSPVVDHFGSPSAADGRLFVSTGESVTAYQIARVPPEEKPLEEHHEEHPPTGGGALTSSPSSGAFKATSTSPAPTQSQALVQLLHRHLYSSAAGRVKVTLLCPAASTSACAGSVVLLAELRPGGHRHARLVTVRLAEGHFGPARGPIRLILRLGTSTRLLLRHHHHITLAILIKTAGARTQRLAVQLSQTL